MRQLPAMLTFCILFSCQTEKEKIISTYADGKPKVVFYFTDASDTLTYRKEVFYPSGNYSYTGNIVNGKKEGVWTWWYENGYRKDKCTYVNGFYTDTVFHWLENSRLKQIEIIPEHVVGTNDSSQYNGTIIRYYENGKLKEKFTSEKGKFQGTYIRYEEDGGWSIKTYKDNLLWGPVISHYVDSATTVIVVGQYENGNETGLWRWFNQDSITTKSAEYNDGEPNGVYTTYYLNGKIESEGKLKNGFQDGVFKFYTEKGKLKKIEKYKEGILIK